MLNGDFRPSRLAAQQEAIMTLFNYKKRSHPENSVGLMTMTGTLGTKKIPATGAVPARTIPAPMVLTSLTEDSGKLLKVLHPLKPISSLTSASATTNISANAILDATLPLSNLTESLKIAQLALKHRANKAQAQRIVLFLSASIADLAEAAPDASSAAAIQEALTLAKSFKKNNIALDVVHFTHLASSPTHLFLDELVTVANHSDNGHILHLIPSDGNLSDKVLQSKILSGSGSSQAGTGGSDANSADPFGGIDPELDPELALALKMSLEEEQARLQSAMNATSNDNTQQQNDIAMQLDEDIDPELAAAIAMSLQQNNHHNISSDAKKTDSESSPPKRKFQDEDA